MHVGFNMLVLAQVGPFMERLLGNVGFLIVYLACGIAGSVCSLAWHPYLVSVGASGAIFGLYGALIGFLILRRDSIPPPVLTRILKGALIFLAYNAVFGLLKSGTDLAAHAGGLAGGLVCGLAISTPINAGFTRRRLVRAAIAGLACIAVVMCIASVLPHPIDLQASLSKFGSAEGKILTSYKAILSQSANAKDSDIADKIEAQVIKPWSVARQSLGNIKGLPSQQQRFVTNVLELHGCAAAWMDESRARVTNPQRRASEPIAAATN